ncbi:MAG: acyl-CoA thioesterase [Suilimivivens sp.]
MKPYTHKVQYYETDKMGITHHSNYIRWMEEARIDFLDQIGWSYAKMEEEGIISPVLAVDCRYKHSTTFSDEVSVTVKVKEFKGVRLILEYTMINIKDDSDVLIGTTEHCFLNTQSRPINMKKEFPELFQVLTDLVC